MHVDGSCGDGEYDSCMTMTTLKQLKMHSLDSLEFIHDHFVSRTFVNAANLCEHVEIVILMRRIHGIKDYSTVNSFACVKLSFRLRETRSA